MVGTERLTISVGSCASSERFGVQEEAVFAMARVLLVGSSNCVAIEDRGYRGALTGT